MSFKRIVVGTDGSDTAAVAVAQSLGLAHRIGAEVVVVTAYPKGEGGDASPAEVAQSVLRDVRRQHPDAAMDTRAGEGDPVDVVLSMSAETGADLVVVGNRGLTGKRVLGGIPDRISHHAPSSVLIADTRWAAILPTGADPHARQEVGKILIATDGSPTADAAVDAGAGLAAALGAEILLVCVNEESHARAVLQRTAHGLEGGPPIHRFAVAGDPPTRIVEVAAEAKADLIVVGNKGMHGMRRVFLGGVPNFVSHHADRSVLIVKTT
ncbi:MAG TPA: universal stress protein [Actinomycetota bacterium]